MITGGHHPTNSEWRLLEAPKWQDDGKLKREKKSTDDNGWIEQMLLLFVVQHSTAIYKHHQIACFPPPEALYLLQCVMKGFLDSAAAFLRLCSLECHNRKESFVMFIREERKVPSNLAYKLTVSDIFLENKNTCLLCSLYFLYFPAAKVTKTCSLLRPLIVTYIHVQLYFGVSMIITAINQARWYEFISLPAGSRWQNWQVFCFRVTL